MKFTEEIDKIKITTLIENKAGKIKGILGQHGLSFFIEMTLNNKNQCLLFDTGPNIETLKNNARLLKLNLKNIEMIFLSHCHYDHTGGLIDLTKYINKNIDIVAHPDIFRKSYKAISEKLVYNGIPDKDPEEKILKSKGVLNSFKSPYEIMPGVMTTGEIEKNEKYKSKRFYKTSNGKYIEDFMRDDISLIFNLKDKGILIVTGCSHSGIVEIIEQSLHLVENKKLYGIIGGFHTFNKKKEEIMEISKQLKKFNPEKIITGHCTGFETMCILKEKFNEKFEELYAGKTIEL